MTEVVGVIKERFKLPDDAKQKWYPKTNIDLHDPDEFQLPSEPPATTARSDHPLTTVHAFEWSEC